MNNQRPVRCTSLRGKVILGVDGKRGEKEEIVNERERRIETEIDRKRIGAVQTKRGK